MVLALACGDDIPSTTDTDDSSTSEGMTTSPSTSLSTSTTVNPSTTGETETATDTETTTGPDTDTTGETDTTTTGETETESSSTGPMDCGNGAVDAGEDCDGAELDGQDCEGLGHVGGELACNDDCTFDETGCVDQLCDNGAIEGTEVCDTDDLDGEDCISQGADAGELGCADDCLTFDTTNCVMFSCGDNMVNDAGEVCDGTDLEDEDCVSQGHFAGTLACAGNCMAFDETGCVENICGNDTVEGPEVCDGDNFNGGDCASNGFIGGGALACAADCLSVDTTGCSDTVCVTPMLPFGPGPLNGPVLATIDVPSTPLFVTDVDVTVDITHAWLEDVEIDIRHVDTDTPVELQDDQCTSNDNVDAIFDQDGVAVVCSAVPPGISGNVLPRGNLNNFEGIPDAGGTWELRVFDDEAPDAGTLNEYCITVQTSTTDPVTCGDASAQFGEFCDGADTRGQSCVGLGYLAGGELVCTDDCSTYDTTGCLGPQCGNAIAEAPEACDGADLAGATCVGLGFDGGTPTCNANCTINSGPCFTCGDSVVEAPELCDTREISGTQCEDLGFVGGALDCDPDACGFDTSECSNSVIAVCNAAGAAIVDLMTLTSTISLMDMGNVADVDVFVNITHTFDGDLDIRLRNAAGTTIDLSTDLCGGGDNVFATFNDEGNGLPNCIPPVAIEGNIDGEGLLSTFDATAIAGNWDLLVGDDAGGDIGTLVEWCIYITPA